VGLHEFDGRDGLRIGRGPQQPAELLGKIIGHHARLPRRRKEVAWPPAVRAARLSAAFERTMSHRRLSCRGIIAAERRMSRPRPVCGAHPHRPRPNLLILPSDSVTHAYSLATGLQSTPRGSDVRATHKLSGFGRCSHADWLRTRLHPSPPHKPHLHQIREHHILKQDYVRANPC